MWKEKKYNVRFRIFSENIQEKVDNSSGENCYIGQPKTELAQENNSISLISPGKIEEGILKENANITKENTEVIEKTEKAESVNNSVTFSSPVLSEEVSTGEQTIRDVENALSVLEEHLKEEFARTASEIFSVNRNGNDSAVESEELNTNEKPYNNQEDEKQHLNNEEEADDYYAPSEYIIDEEDDDSALIELDLDLLEKELKREKEKRRFFRLVISTFNGLVVTAAIAILVAMLWMPVLQIYGSSMTPVLEEGNVVVAVKDKNFNTGDLVAFYYGNKLLVKRCIAGPADWIDIDKEGNVKVNGKLIDEPYVSEKSLGECDIEFPFQVPEEQWFLMGDHRKTSVDSRSNTIGTVSSEQIIGKVVLRVWPLNQISLLD